MFPFSALLSAASVMLLPVCFSSVVSKSQSIAKSSVASLSCRNVSKGRLETFPVESKTALNPCPTVCVLAGIAEVISIRSLTTSTALSRPLPRTASDGSGRFRGCRRCGVTDSLAPPWLAEAQLVVRSDTTI